MYILAPLHPTPQTPNELYFLMSTGRTFQLRASDEACTPPSSSLYYSQA